MKRSFVFEKDYNIILRLEAEEALCGKKGKVLNIACEFNLIPDFLKGLVNVGDVYGVEINEEVVKTTPNIRFCDVDRDLFPFDNASMDAVLSICGIEHFQTDNVFKETQRILKETGRMIFITPNVGNPLVLFNKISKGFAARFYFRYLTDSLYQSHDTNYRFNTAGAIQKAAVKQGLRLIKVIYFGPSFFTKYFEFNRFLEVTVVLIDRLITNQILGYFKPYLICVVEKSKM